MFYAHSDISGNGFEPTKIDLPAQGGRSRNFRGSKNQKSGKCHELPRKLIKTKCNPHPTG